MWFMIDKGIRKSTDASMVHTDVICLKKGGLGDARRIIDTRTFFASKKVV